MSKDMAYLENVRIRVRHLVRAASANQEVAALLGLVGVGIFFSLATPYFLTPLNLFQLTRQMAVLAVIAAGMALVISTGEIDISVGAVYNLAANVMALSIARSGMSPWTSALVAVAVGLIAGALNGSIAVALGLPTLIVTLGTVSLFRGITIVLSGGLSIGNLPDSSFYQMGSEGVGPVPFVVLVALLFVAVLAWIYRKTVFVRQLLAIGSNADAAARVGVRTKLRKVQVMAVNGLMCGLAAVLGIAYLRAASPQSGVGYEMSAIAAVVVGGTPLTGGVGSVWGTLVGIALIVAIQNGLMLMGLPTAWQVASTGAMLLGAVALQQLVQLRRGT
jgi:ribose transport system permease protein